MSDDMRGQGCEQHENESVRARARRVDRARAGTGPGPRGVLPALRRGARAAVPRRRRRGAGGARSRTAHGVRGPAVRSHGRDRGSTTPAPGPPATLGGGGAVRGRRGGGAGGRAQCRAVFVTAADVERGDGQNGVVTANFVAARLGGAAGSGHPRRSQSVDVDDAHRLDRAGRGRLHRGDGRRREPRGRDLYGQQGLRRVAAPLHVDPQDIRSAKVVRASGTVIATATLG